ncbi:MAG: hypothetical protein ACXVRP_08605, partial [Solirubrobacteraceae bacterium]
VAMIELDYEMTYEETIAGPMGSTKGSPLGERLCWTIETARLHGPRYPARTELLMEIGPDPSVVAITVDRRLITSIDVMRSPAKLTTLGRR